MAGEYGTEGGRPHYHACVFGWKPRDTVVWREKKDFKLFTSEFTNKIWGNGYVVVGDVTFDSAAYVARYVLKKLAGGGKQDQESPEYVAMSRKPGIAEKWFQKYKDDVYPHDKLIISDKIKLRPPRYFDDRYEVDHKRQMELIKAKRRKKGKTMGPEGEWDRMQVKRRLKEYKINHLQRSFENGNLQRPGQQNGNSQRSSILP